MHDVMKRPESLVLYCIYHQCCQTWKWRLSDIIVLRCTINCTTHFCGFFFFSQTGHLLELLSSKLPPKLCGEFKSDIARRISDERSENKQVYSIVVANARPQTMLVGTTCFSSLCKVLFLVVIKSLYVFMVQIHVIIGYERQFCHTYSCYQQLFHLFNINLTIFLIGNDIT